MDNNDKKLKFIQAMTKHGLEHFDNGGIAGAIGSVLGTNNNFQASPGTNAQQLGDAYNGAESGIAQQQGFVNQAAAQNGFGNQSNVFAQQQALSNQLQNQANGQGPNPAQAALNQSTGVNVANQGALMASQRGASSNPGLIARQAAQQGAATQQQAVGQGATLQAQQQIAAQSALANQQAQMQSVAANQIATQGQGTTNLSSAQQGEQGILQGANNSANTINAGVAAGNQKANQGLVGGALNAVGSLFAHGGMVKKFADGGLTSPGLSAPGSVPQSFAGQWLNAAPIAAAQAQDNSGEVKPMYAAKEKAPQKPDSTQSAGIQLSGMGGSGAVEDAGDAALPISDMMMAAGGGKVKATKNQQAVKAGDSYSNDKVPAMLSQGELVIDRDTMNDKGPMGQMARALAAHIQKRNGKKS